MPQAVQDHPASFPQYGVIARIPMSVARTVTPSSQLLSAQRLVGVKHQQSYQRPSSVSLMLPWSPQACMAAITPTSPVDAATPYALLTGARFLPWWPVALVDVPGLEGLGFLRSGPMWFQ